jgi:hypothetical protein
MDIKAKTKHGELTLDEIGSLMPGMSEPMAAIGQRYQTTSHAARDGNWLLAAYQLRAIRKIVRHVEADQAEVRPSDG